MGYEPKMECSVGLLRKGHWRGTAGWAQRPGSHPASHWHDKGETARQQPDLLTMCQPSWNSTHLREGTPTGRRTHGVEGVAPMHGEIARPIPHPHNVWEGGEREGMQRASQLPCKQNTGQPVGCRTHWTNSAQRSRDNYSSSVSIKISCVQCGIW